MCHIRGVLFAIKCLDRAEDEFSTTCPRDLIAQVLKNWGIRQLSRSCCGSNTATYMGLDGMDDIGYATTLTPKEANIGGFSYLRIPLIRVKNDDTEGSAWPIRVGTLCAYCFTKFLTH